jgi:sulfur carrier protein ThiS
MRVHLHPQRRTVEVAGRRMVGRLLAELGVLPNTAMVIRRDELLTDGEFVEDDEEIEIRAVISGGCGTASPIGNPRTTPTAKRKSKWEHGRPRPRGRASEDGREAAARTGAIRGFAGANPLLI